MDHDTIRTALSFLGATLPLLMLYGSVGGMLPFVAAQGRIRILSDSDTIVARAWDPAPMFWSGFAVFGAIGPCFIIFGISGGALASLIAIVLWCGFRVEVRAERESTRVLRKFAYVIPWSWRLHTERPKVFVDGWGDFADPEALHVSCGDLSIELAWNTKNSGVDFDALAKRFNDAVAALRA